jgi:DNA-binding NarL/FixJ family response regulator
MGTPGSEGGPGKRTGGNTDTAPRSDPYNEGLRATIRELLTDDGIQIVGEAGDSATALRAIPPAAYGAPLIVLMDVRLPGPINGIEATRLLADRCADVRVIMFTAFPGEAIDRAARGAGAVGLLIKGVRPETILSTINQAWSAVPIGR